MTTKTKPYWRLAKLPLAVSLASTLASPAFAVSCSSVASTLNGSTVCASFLIVPRLLITQQVLVSTLRVYRKAREYVPSTGSMRFESRNPGISPHNASRRRPRAAQDEGSGKPRLDRRNRER